METNRKGRKRRVSSNSEEEEDAKRLARKENEKQRRDKLNYYITELANQLPVIERSNRRLDKTSILRLAVNYLKVHQDLLKRCKDINHWPNFLRNPNLTDILLESFNGFILACDEKSEIVFASDTITEVLGYKLADILGCPLLNFVHPADHSKFVKAFENVSNDKQRNFVVRLARNDNNGYVRLDFFSFLNKRTNYRTYLISVCRLAEDEPTTELLPIADESNQWVTQHSMDGKIIFSDPRGCLITGFLSSESIGFSAYALVHPDDIGPIVLNHNIFLTTGDIPNTCFRMFTKTKNTIYIRNRSHMVVDMWTSKPRHIISVNEVIDKDEGEKLLNEQRALVTRYNDNGLQMEDITERMANMMTTDSEPEIDMESEDDKVKVVVGETKYRIDLARQELFPRKGYHVSRKTVVDTGQYNVQKDVPFVKPSFNASIKRTLSDCGCDNNKIREEIKGPASAPPYVPEDSIDIDSQSPMSPENELLQQICREISIPCITIDCLSEKDKARLDLCTKLVRKLTEINEAIRSKETCAANLRTELLKGQQSQDMELVHRLSITAKQMTDTRQLLKKTMTMLQEKLNKQLDILINNIKTVSSNNHSTNDLDEIFKSIPSDLPNLDVENTFVDLLDIDLDVNAI